LKHANILVVGGSGFVGRHLVAALAARGVNVTVPTRRRDRAKHLILLPTVDVIEADVRDANTLAELAAGCDAVVNLAGILHGPGFQQTHVELAQAVVNACRRAGVKTLLHMSALGADRAAPSEYLRSKGIGEQAALAADDLEVTVFRPVGDLRARGPLPEPVRAAHPVLRRCLPSVLPTRASSRSTWATWVRAFRRRAGTIGMPHGKRYDSVRAAEYTLRQLVEFVCAGHGATPPDRRPARQPVLPCRPGRSNCFP
jgi:NADH dehydrogenase